MALITTLIADAQLMFAEALGRALASIPEFLIFDSHPTEASKTLEAVKQARPDVALLDYWIGGDGGAPTITRGILAAAPECKVIVLSWLHGPREIESALQAGAVGFLPKSQGVEVAAEAIRQAHRGENPVLPETLGLIRKTLDDRNRQGYQDWQRAWEKLRTLTRREIEILALISKGRRVEQVAEDLFISIRTVRNHIHNILDKTGAATQLEVVTMARHYRLIP